MDKINISKLEKAKKKFEQFRKHLTTEQEKAGAIQAFEYCYELTWKIMKRVLEVRGKIVNSPRETFREAAIEQLIDEPEIWFDFINIRNLTVYTYEEDNVERVILAFDEFSKKISSFLEKINHA